jgi:protein tyrosine phosphatase
MLKKYVDGKQIITRAFDVAQREMQREIRKLRRLYYYEWDDTTNSIKEIPTEEYRRFKEKWNKILPEDMEITKKFAGIV